MYNEIDVTLPDYEGSVILFLSSYAAVNWRIVNPNYTRVAGVVLSSYSPGSTCQRQFGEAVFDVTDFEWHYDNLEQAALDIETITGRVPDYTDSGYALSEVIVPSLD